MKEIKELVRLDAMCFDPPVNYTIGEMEYYLLRPSSVLFRKFQDQRMVAFCLGNMADGNIVTIDVHPRYRRRGYGKILLQQIIDKFSRHNVKEAVSQVAIDNLPSVMLHKNFGFEIRAVMYGYYPDGRAAFEMALPLRREKLHMKS